jgi:hypothetical protein
MYEVLEAQSTTIEDKKITLSLIAKSKTLISTHLEAEQPLMNKALFSSPSPQRYESPTCASNHLNTFLFLLF